jgi:hypothetical protein
MRYVNFGKKGQLKVQQMAFMLLAVTLFFVLVGLFFLAIKYSSLKQTATELERENTQLLITKLANSPEFSCGDAFDQVGTNCIDSDKIMILKAHIGKYETYWGDLANIEIRKVYPVESTINCEISNYPECNSIKLFDNEVKGFYISNFVALCRKEQKDDSSQDKCELARLMVAYNEK